jgi:anti-sigma factor RsiW
MNDNDGLPTNSTDLKLMVQALVDGELDAATTLSLERRIGADPALAAEQARLEALRASLRRLPRPEVGEAFLARIAAIGAPAEVPLPPVARRPRVFDWRALAASVFITALLSSGATYWTTMRDDPDSFAEAVASSHRRSLLAASPIDVASSDRHTVKPWLDARIGLSPPAADLTQEGFTLVGGRVDVIGNQVVPTLVYRHREHLITLVAAPQGRGQSNVPSAVQLSAGGFSVVHWTEGTFSYWAISDMERPELDDFVNRFRAATAGG